MEVEGKNRKYKHYNYNAYNNAVNLVAKEHASIAAEVAYKSKISKARLFLYYASGVSLVILILAIIYVLLNTEWNKKSPPAPLVTTIESTRESGQNEQISNLPESVTAQEFGVTTEFTVFKQTPTANGEIVVTGQQYKPDNLKSPFHQYCYLTNDTSIANANEIELASIAENGLSITTEDNYLINEVFPLCNFINLKK